MTRINRIAAVISAAALCSCTAMPPERPELHPLLLSGERPYVYQSLSHRERVLYDTIASALMYHKDTLRLDSSQGYGYDEIYEAYSTIYSSEYRLFFISPRFAYNDADNTITFEYTCSPAEQEMMQKDLDSAARSILARAEGFDEYGTALVIHDEIIKSCRYGEGEYQNTAYGCLVQGCALCQGYTAAFSYLCSLAGIQTLAAEDADGEHMWSEACIDGSWYHIDTTWDDPDDEKRPGYVKYDWFSLGDEDMRRFHSIRKDIPRASSGRSYFDAYDLTADSPDSAEKLVSVCEPDAGGAIQFRAADRQCFDDIRDRLFGEGGSLGRALSGRGMRTDNVEYSLSADTLVIRIFPEYE